MYMWKVAVGFHKYIVTGVRTKEAAEKLAIRMHKQRYQNPGTLRVTDSFELEQIDFKTAVWIDRK